MRIKVKKILTKTLFWLTVEISLNFLGLDNLADYSEFVFKENVVTIEC